MSQKTMTTFVLLLVVVRIGMRVGMDVTSQDLIIAFMGIGYSFFSVALCAFFLKVKNPIANAMAIETMVDVVASVCTTIFSLFTVFDMPVPPDLQIDMRYAIMNGVQLANLHSYYVIVSYPTTGGDCD